MVFCELCYLFALKTLLLLSCLIGAFCEIEKSLFCFSFIIPFRPFIFVLLGCFLCCYIQGYASMWCRWHEKFFPISWKSDADLVKQKQWILFYYSFFGVFLSRLSLLDFVLLLLNLLFDNALSDFLLLRISLFGMKTKGGRKLGGIEGVIWQSVIL